MYVPAENVPPAGLGGAAVERVSVTQGPVVVTEFKLVGLLWQMSTPVASDGGAAECAWNINVSNVRFY